MVGLKNGEPGKTQRHDSINWLGSSLRILTVANNGAPGRIRTSNLLIRSQALYPIEPRAHKCFFLGARINTGPYSLSPSGEATGA